MIIPNVSCVTAPFGMAAFIWLSKFWASKRSCSLRCSLPSGNSFRTERFHSLYPGPRQFGNVLVQAIAAGRFASLADARRYEGEQVQLKTYEPRPSRAWEEAARRYDEIERRYLKDE